MGGAGAGRGAPLPVMAALAALMAFALMVLESMRRAGGFEYPLDDVYIHLAMAVGVSGGTYGVNPGEPAAAASSILYPLLLLPFPGTGIQRMLPLLWNGAAVAAAGWIWGRGLALSRLPQGLALALALVGPLGLNLAGVGFTGMEHALHAALAMAGVLGLWLWLSERRLAWWFAAAVLLAPMVRYEALALSLLAAGAVAVTGRPGAGVLLALGALLPPVLFGWWLTTLGLDPLPSSVLTKLHASDPSHTAVRQLAERLGANLALPPGWLLLALPLGLLLRAGLGRGEGRARLLLAAAAAAGLAQLLLGRAGWMSRYETYAIAAMALALVLAWDRAGRRPGPLGGPAATLLVTLAGLFAFLPLLLTIYLGNPRAILLQHAQMARLSQDFAPVPVAVNDIGRVVWGAPAYVLDLWGLAYQPAREIRQDGGAPPGWAQQMAAEKGVRFAMIYADWFPPAARPGWVPVGRLRLPEGRPFVVGGPAVTVFAADPAYEADLRVAIEAWRPGLPAAARWEPLP